MVLPITSLSVCIEQASRGEPAPVERMGVYPARSHVAVAWEFLHRVDRPTPGGVLPRRSSRLQAAVRLSSAALGASTNWELVP